MSLNKFVLTILLVLGAAAQAKTLKNFVPGPYDLIKGNVDQCGTGEFKMREDGEGVLFGVYHGFNIQNATSNIEADIPEFSGCIYETRDSVGYDGKKTNLSFQEILRCNGGVIRHTLNKTATVSPGKVEIHVEQKGNPEFGAVENSYNYQCEFKLHTTGKK